MILNELLILKIEEGILNLIHLVKDCSRIAQGLLEDSLRIKRESWIDAQRVETATVWKNPGESRRISENLGESRRDVINFEEIEQSSIDPEKVRLIPEGQRTW